MRVWVLPHAADRFVERVRPGLGRREASIELTRLVREFGRVLEAAPEWLPPWAERGRLFVEISDGVVVVVEPAKGSRRLPQAVTVLCRSTFAPERREGRNARRRGRPSARVVKLVDRSRPSKRDRWAWSLDDEMGRSA